MIHNHFFYSTDTDKLTSGKHKGIFLNNNLQRDSTIQLTTDNYYVVEYTMPENRKLRDQNRKEDATTGDLRSFYGLVMREKDLTQLAPPFPFFIRSYSTISLFKKDENAMVKALDKELNRSYKELLQTEKQ